MRLIVFTCVVSLLVCIFVLGLNVTSTASMILVDWQLFVSSLISCHCDSCKCVVDTSVVRNLVMHRISGSALPDIRPFLISSSGGKLSDSELDCLLIYCMLLCDLSDFCCISTLNIQYTHCVFEFNQWVCVCVWWFVIMCMRSNFELFAYNPSSQHSDRKFGEWTINCTAVHYPVPVLVGYLICYPTLSSSGRIPKMLSGASLT